MVSRLLKPVSQVRTCGARLSSPLIDAFRDSRLTRRPLLACLVRSQSYDWHHWSPTASLAGGIRAYRDVMQVVGRAPHPPNPTNPAARNRPAAPLPTNSRPTRPPCLVPLGDRWVRRAESPLGGLRGYDLAVTSGSTSNYVALTTPACPRALFPASRPQAERSIYGIGALRGRELRRSQQIGDAAYRLRTVVERTAPEVPTCHLSHLILPPS